MLRDWLHKPKSLHPPIQDAVWKIALDGKNLVSGICETPTDDAVGYRGDATTPVLSIAGAVVAVVCRDRILTSRGYGYANIDRKVPMTPNTTAVQVGSVSKLFTWTAAMQLADSRQLNLDAPIYGYLDFHLTTTFDTPITRQSNAAGVFQPGEARVFSTAHSSETLLGFGRGLLVFTDKKRTKYGVLQRVQLIQQRLEAVMKGLQNLYPGVRFSPAPPSGLGPAWRSSDPPKCQKSVKRLSIFRDIRAQGMNFGKNPFIDVTE